MPNDEIKQWSPGVLCRKQLKFLCDNDQIHGVNKPNTCCGLSSIDLCLSDEAYDMIEGSVKPAGKDEYYSTMLRNNNLAIKLDPERGEIFLLKKGNTYVFRLMEKLQIGKYPYIHGQATAKSTIGRVDVLARLIVDGMDCYDSFEPKNINGDMYLEISPITFDVRVKPGIALTQLRLFKGEPENSLVKKNEIELYGENILNPNNDEYTLSVDLSNCDIRNVTEATAAFFARRHERNGDKLTPIDLWVKGKSKRKKRPCEYWLFQKSNNNRLKIENAAFYILRSMEKIALPHTLAIYCKAMDETIGEMRIHYAGFVHPFFGLNREDQKVGTPLIFEVRGHDLDVSLGHGEKMAKLQFYRMSESPRKPKSKPYDNQTLKLSDLFLDWPKKIQVGSDGKVKPIED